MKEKIISILKERINFVSIVQSKISSIKDIDINNNTILYENAFDILEEIDNDYSLADIDDLVGLGENERWFDYLVEDVMKKIKEI